MSRVPRTGSLEGFGRFRSDTHDHAFGGGNRAWIARMTGRDIAPLDHPLNSMAEMHEWVGGHIGPLHLDFAVAHGLRSQRIYLGLDLARTVAVGSDPI